MASTNSTPQGGYQPSARLLQRLDEWEKARDAVSVAREALEEGIALELTENRRLNLPTIAEHLPFSAEMIRLLMAGRDVPPRERHRKEEGDPPVYKPSERLRDRLAGLHTAEGVEGKAREALEEAIADELRANPALTNPELAEYLPWKQEQIRLIARAHNVPRRRKRGSEHRLITDDKGNPKSVVVPYDWYVRQKGADPSIVKR